MKIEQLYTGCLSQGTYYIKSNGEAAIIDPLREISQYLDKAKKDKVKIKYIFETHFHADFVSGHVTLSEKTNAPIIYGPLANPSYDAHIAKDEEIFNVGNIKIKAIHTPGHTIESTTYLLYDENNKEHSIFSGDTLFLGDVGRPDLAQKAANMTQEQLAGMLFDSLRSKIMCLPDTVLVYPAHGAGSSCGKKMLKQTVDTLGNQKRTNYALRKNMSKKEFVNEVLNGLESPPEYFPSNVKLNKEGYKSIETILSNAKKEIKPKNIENIISETGAIILDLRKPEEFAREHIPNSIFIGLDGNFAPWVGELIVDIKQPLILIVAENREEEAITRLSRVGFDNTLGVLSGGIEAWKKYGKEVDDINSVPAIDFEKIYDLAKDNVFDVRKNSEYKSKHILSAQNTPLNHINEFLDYFPEFGYFYIHCASGYRSMIAASILKSRGIHNLINIEGGIKEIEKTNILISESTCPSQLNKKRKK